MSHNKYIHDLNNKLAILFGMLRCCKLGIHPPEDQIDAVTGRINEIVTGLYKHLNHVNADDVLAIKANQRVFNHFMEAMSAKLGKIYMQVDLSFVPDQGSWENLHVAFDKELLYQILENAVENSVNAKSKKIEMKLLRKQNEIMLELSDDGEGFEHLKISDQRLMPKSTGTTIIKENMKMMNGQAFYSDNIPTGVTLRLIFPVV